MTFNIHALIKAAEAINGIVATVKAAPNGSGRGVYAADGKATLRDVIIPLDALDALRNALPTATDYEHLKALAEDISWLGPLRSDYAQLVEQIGPDIDAYVSSWDDDAHRECLRNTEAAINELKKMFPYNPAGDVDEQTAQALADPDLPL